MIYLSLFVAALGSATILPGASEVVLAAAIRDGSHSVFWLWFYATVGNTLGSVCSWALGRYFLHWQHHRLFPLSPSRLASAEAYFNRRGRWSLLFIWVPVVGDALAVVAGVLRVPLLPFLLLAGIGKGFRYAVTAALILQVWPLP